MNSVISNWFLRVSDPAWLAGPIFDKELRVSSRRRRNYVLRFLYIAFFTVLLSLFWIAIVAPGTTSVYQISRMARAGQGIICVVIWFQFIMTQVVAIVMLSTSISDEIYRRTLGVLMTTPIGSFQIVFGKLLSKLLQLVLLLGIALPLLAIVRVFGGVPWDFLVCSLCVTLTTVILVGSLSLFFSIFTRRAYVTIIATILALALLFAFIPLIMAFLTRFMIQQGLPWNLRVLLCYVNPYVMMFFATEALATARRVGSANWPAHCGIMLGASAPLLLGATVLVRRAALRQAVGQTRTGRWRRSKGTTQNERVRRVAGSPVFWKERRTPLLGRRRIVMIVLILLGLGLLLLTYALCAANRMLGDEETHAAYVIVFTALGMLFTVVVPATCITSEKESRAWPLLLTTTLGDWEIVWGKLRAAVWRCLPAWVPLFGHVVVFALAGMIHPVALVQLGILVAWILIFLSSTGLYFSTRFKHTTTAVIANMALAAGIWLVVPLLLGIMLAITGGGDDLLELNVDLNPFVHAGVIAGATAHRGGPGAYEWMQGGMSDVADATGWIVLNFVIYVVTGLVFVARARSRLRRNPF
jgi:ABC-type transport system involved in multi-copper enzyme maturation permease subunit